MASFDTTLYGLQKSTRTNPARIAAPNQSSGAVQVAVIPYLLATTEAAADTINLCVLPEGAIPLPGMSCIVCDADPGTAFTVKIGNTADDDGWGVAPVGTVAGKIDMCQLSTTQPAWLVPTKLSADSDPTSGGSGNTVIRATVVTATALNAVNVYFHLAYKLNA